MTAAAVVVWPLQMCVRRKRKKEKTEPPKTIDLTDFDGLIS